jgi:chromosome segregation ATPase
LRLGGCHENHHTIIIMTQATDTDIREIKTAIESIAKATEANSKAIVDLTQEMRTGFTNVDTRFTKLDGRIDTLETRVLGKFDTVNARLTNLESNTKAVADLAEKIGEFKNWKQVAFVIFSAVIGGGIGYFLKGGKI